MNFKKYKALPLSEKKSESCYVIGLDIGNDSSAIAFYNFADSAAESIDLSGGYGKPSVPTVMQYIPETTEWVFGEYALLNSGVGTLYSGLLSKMGQFQHLDVNGRSVSVAGVFALFIKEILAGVKNINPKAEIVGIVASVPAYFSDAAREEFTRAFKLAGYEKELIALVPDRECVLAHHCYVSRPLVKSENISAENLQKEGGNVHRLKFDQQTLLIIDFGNRELRGGLYELSVKDNGTSATDSGMNVAENGINAVSLSSLFDTEISMSALNADVAALFTSFVADVPDSLRGQFDEFVYRNRDILFQKNIRAKSQKVYCNFMYPPTQHVITNEIAEELIAPYARRFEAFVQDVMQKSLKSVSPAQVDAVVCVGGGFEMLWARDAVMAAFPKERVVFHKNPKVINAEGAALVAARELGLFEGLSDSGLHGKDLHIGDLQGKGAHGGVISLEDRHQLTNDIGIAVNENFLTLVARNGFWWQKHLPKIVLVKDEITDIYVLEINLASQSPEGESRTLATVQLDGLPPRPKGTMRLQIGVSFTSNTEMCVRISDCGFGEFFPATGYVREYNVKL